MSIGDAAAGSQQGKSHGWKALVFAGVLGIIGGIAAIVIPVIPTLLFSQIIGWVLVFTGVGTLIDAFSGGSASRVIIRLLLGLLTVAVGLYIVFAPLSGVLTLTEVLAFLFIISGVVRLFAAFSERSQPGAGSIGLSAVAGIAVGVLILVQLPDSAAWAIGLLVGVDLMLFGFTSLAAGMAAKRPAAV